MTEYDINQEFCNAVEAMLADDKYEELNPIREQELQIFSMLVVRHNTKGEPLPPKDPPVVCRRIPPVFEALTKGHYVVLADHEFWTHSAKLVQDAALHCALSAILVEVSDKGVKLKTKAPDFVGYRTNVKRFGAWKPPLVDIRDALKQSAKQFAENAKLV
jgi:hypothetical protein